MECLQPDHHKGQGCGEGSVGEREEATRIERKKKIGTSRDRREEKGKKRKGKKRRKRGEAGVGV